MRRSGRPLILLGVMMGLAAVLLGVFAMSGSNSEDAGTEAASKPQDITVVQVKQDVPAHTILTEADLEEVVVKDDALTGDEARSVGQVIGFAYGDDLIKGQRIMQSQLEVSGVAEELVDGARAISVPVDSNNMVAGLVREDDRIDIIYQINADIKGVFPTTPVESQGSFEAKLEGGTDENGEDTPELILPPYGQAADPAPYPFPGEPGSRITIKEANAGNPISKVVLQNVRVLRVVNEAIAAEGDTANAAGDFLVLEVTPEQAELLRLMQNVGSFQVMLRNPNDEEQAATSGANMEILFSKYGMPAPKTVRLPDAGAQ